jgi:hypothetical protein
MCIPLLPTSYCPIYLIHLDLFSLIMLGKAYKLCCSLYIFHQPPVTSSLFVQMFSSAPCCLCSSLNIKDQVSCPYRTKNKIIVLYFLMFMFLGSRQDRRIRQETRQKIGSKNY